MAFTLANAKQFLRDKDAEDGSSRAERIYIKIANDANLAFRKAGLWAFDKRYERIAFNGQYTTGTVAVTAGGTTITGTDTVWTTAMTGRYIRMNGESLQYEVTYSSPTSFTIASSGTYQGESNLSGKSYILTEERKALPARFRCMAQPMLDQIEYRLFPKPLEEIKRLRQYYAQTNYPNYYAVEWVEDVSSVPQPYMWIYPGPSSKRVIEIPYFAWPPEATADANVFYVPFEAEDCLRAFMLAYLMREQGKGDWGQQLGLAQAQAKESLGALEPVAEDRQRMAWYPGCEDGEGPFYPTVRFSPDNTFGV